MGFVLGQVRKAVFAQSAPVKKRGTVSPASSGQISRDLVHDMMRRNSIQIGLRELRKQERSLKGQIAAAYRERERQSVSGKKGPRWKTVFGKPQRSVSQGVAEINREIAALQNQLRAVQQRIAQLEAELRSLG